MGMAKFPQVERQKEQWNKFVARTYMQTIPDALMMAFEPMLGLSRITGATKATKGLGGFLKGLRPGQMVEELGVKYDGPWEFSGKILSHQFTDMNSGRTFATKGLGLDEVSEGLKRILND